MCFVANEDYDWIAAFIKKADAIATMTTRCNECGAEIPVGAFVHTVHMREVEEGGCVDCDRGDCECVDDCCQCETPDYGETQDYARCEDCHKFLAAVRLAEIAAGCAEHESQPDYGAMIDDIGCSNGNRDEAKKYFKQAQRSFPELVTSGYLGRLWRTMFVH